MKSFSFFLLSAALFVASVSAQLTVNTPVNVIECAPLTVTWSGGTPPYFLSVHSGNDVNGAPLLSFPSTTEGSLTWPAVNFTAGTSLDLSLRDSGGLSSQSAVFTVQASGDESCLNGGATPSGSDSAAGSSAATPAATPAATTATTPAASGSSTARASGSSTSSRPSSSTSTSNAAMATGITYGAAGVLGAAIAAVFV